MNFYSKYEKLCKQIGKTASRVAIELDISKTAVSNWKNSGGSPTPENLLKIAKYFGVPVSYFDENEVEYKFDLQLFAAGLTDQEKTLIEIFRQLDEVKRSKLIVAASDLLQ